MNRPPNLSPIDILALVRLLPAADKGETREKLSKDLKPLVEHRWEGPDWAARLSLALDGLESAGAIVRNKKGKATRFVRTAEGRRLTLEALGLEELPPKTTWAKLKSSYLLSLAIGRPGMSPADAKRLSGVNILKAEILRARYGLDLDERPALKQAVDATAGKLLGLEPGTPFTADEILRKLLRDAGIEIQSRGKPTATSIQEALFRRELGGTDAKKPLDLIVARSVGARQSSAAELGKAALRSWIERSEATTPIGGDDAPFGLVAAMEGRPGLLSLPDFARRVVDAARSSPSGWFGDAKVFIAHVWRALRDDPAFRETDADAFKARLVEAHRARLIELGRADLVEAMDPADVHESATPYLNAVYHFVRTEDQAR